MEHRTLYFIIAVVIQFSAIMIANYVVWSSKCEFTLNQFMFLSILYIFAYAILYINFCQKRYGISS